MTKEEAKKRKEEWTKALIEGRVVRYNCGMTMQSFKTKEEAITWAKGTDGEVVEYPAMVC